MRDPASEKDAGRWAAGGHTGKDPHVIDGHQDHHGSANQIDGLDPRVHGRLDCYWAGCHAHAHSLLREPETHGRRSSFKITLVRRLRSIKVTAGGPLPRLGYNAR